MFLSMSKTALSGKTQRQIALLFREDREEGVDSGLRSAGTISLSGGTRCAGTGGIIAALKLSEGNLDRLREAIAKTDWRDLLMAAELWK